MQIKLISFFVFVLSLFGQNKDKNFWKISSLNNNLKIESQDGLQPSHKTTLNFSGDNLNIYIRENSQADKCISISLSVRKNINNPISFESKLESFAYGCKIPCLSGPRISKETQKRLLSSGLKNLYLLPEDIKKKIRDHIMFLGIKI